MWLNPISTVVKDGIKIEPRKYNVTETLTDSDPRLTNNLLPYHSVLLEGHLFGIIVR